MELASGLRTHVLYYFLKNTSNKRKDMLYYILGMNSVKKKFRSEVLVTSEKVVDRLRDTICSLTINIISSITGRDWIIGVLNIESVLLLLHGSHFQEMIGQRIIL